MDGIQTFFTLLFIAVLLVAVAQKLKVPYPIALVIGGAVLGFIPNMHPIEFEPNFILVTVLPPILYYAAYETSFREFANNWKHIFSLALGLVLVTTFFVGLTFKWMFPQLPWALAFAFGSIVSPPDAIAATTIFKQFRISPRLISLLEGESLINDASALVLYKISVIALLSGSFSWMDGGVQFITSAFGGVVLGTIFGFSAQLLSRKFLQPTLSVVFSFTIPYLVFITAQALEISSVLAVVVSGLIGSRLLLTHHTPLRRILGHAAWDIFIIFLNCFVFIIIGIQLRTIMTLFTTEQIIRYSLYSIMIATVMVIVRMAWIYTISIPSYIKALKNKKIGTLAPKILQEAALIGWSGMRGIVSLAAAIGLPLTFRDGSLLEGRYEVIFITFIVILLTLLLPGLSLPAFIRWLDIEHEPSPSNASKIRKHLVEIAEKKLEQLLTAKTLSKEQHIFLKDYFTMQLQVLELSHAVENDLQNMENARLQVIEEQRKLLIKKWKLKQIDDRLLSHLENELDMLQVHNARADLK